MKFKSGQYIIDRQRWLKTYGGKKFKSTCATIVLLKGDYDPKLIIKSLMSIGGLWIINLILKTYLS